LEGLGALAGMSPRALASQVVGAIHRVIHIHRSADGQRHLSMGTCALSLGGELVLEKEELVGS
jgi:hypothetical protein